MVWYGNGRPMVNVNLYSAIITKVSNALKWYLVIYDSSEKMTAVNYKQASIWG